MNIVMLQGVEQTRRIFRQEQLKQLAEWGTLTVNEEEGRPSAEQLAKLIQGADIAVTSWGCPPIREELLRAAPDLKLIAHAAGTVKGIVTPEVISRGIRVSSANEALGRGVAETALGLAITSLKNIWQLARDTREGGWSENRHKVRELYGITIGIIGAGKAGRHFIRLLQHFEVKVAVYDPVLTEAQIRAMGAVKMDLDSLLEQADVVSIHAPAIPETEKMMNRERLQRMKDDAILINTARGSIIDEEALAAELEKGRLWACLDVTHPEPPSKEHKFRQLPNVTLIPHIAGAVNNGLYRIGDYVMREIESFLTGQPLDGEVNLSQLHVIA